MVEITLAYLFPSIRESDPGLVGYGSGSDCQEKLGSSRPYKIILTLTQYKSQYDYDVNTKLWSKNIERKVAFFRDFKSKCSDRIKIWILIWLLFKCGQDPNSTLYLNLDPTTLTFYTVIYDVLTF